MSTGRLPSYSDAARCTTCGMKAVLSRAGARRLATLAAQHHGALVAYRCPAGNGWHVRRPVEPRHRPGAASGH